MEAIDSMVVQAFHFQIGKEELMKLVKERAEDLDQKHCKDN